MERLNSTDFNNKLAALWAENPNSKLRSTWWREGCEVSDMIDKIITNITLPAEEDPQDMILFECKDGSAYLMYHEQDCCEDVVIDDINGDLDCLIGHYLAMADVAISDERKDLDRGPRGDWWEPGMDEYGTHTWTFYRFATVRGYVDIRWYGESNGYYSESVDFVKIK